MDGCAVAEDIHVIQIHPASLLNGSFHGRLVDAFHADDLDVGPEFFQPARHGCGQTAAADGDVRAVKRAFSAHHHFVRQRSLSGHGHQVVIRMDKSAAVGFRVFMGGCGRLVIAVPMEHDLHMPAAVAAHFRLLHFRRGARHENGGMAVQHSGRQRHALGVIAGGSRHNAFVTGFLAQCGHAIKRSAPLISPDGPQILPFGVYRGLDARQIQSLERSRFANGVDALAGLQYFLGKTVRKYAHDCNAGPHSTGVRPLFPVKQFPGGGLFSGIQVFWTQKSRPEAAVFPEQGGEADGARTRDLQRDRLAL